MFIQDTPRSSCQTTGPSKALRITISGREMRRSRQFLEMALKPAWSSLCSAAEPIRHQSSRRRDFPRRWELKAERENLPVHSELRGMKSACGRCFIHALSSRRTEDTRAEAARFWNAPVLDAFSWVAVPTPMETFPIAAQVTSSVPTTPTTPPSASRAICSWSVNPRARSSPICAAESWRKPRFPSQP